MASEDKVLNVKIRKENHDFINQLRDYMSQKNDTGTWNQAQVVNMILTQARIEFIAGRKGKGKGIWLPKSK